MAVTSANKVADYFLATTRESGDLLTNLKLQKLVYYAQAWHLAIYEKPLFPERFEAWVHGPVQRQLYGRFREYRFEIIRSDVETPELPEDVKNHLEEVLDVYGGFTARELERMTHRETPWLEARGKKALDEPSTAKISEKTMKEYYAQRLEK